MSRIHVIFYVSRMTGWQEEKWCGGERKCLFPAFILKLCAQTIGHMKVIAFQGNAKSSSAPAPPMTLPPIANPNLTPSPDVPLAILKRKLMASNDIRVARELLMEINTHFKVKIEKKSSGVACLRTTVQASHTNQFNSTNWAFTVAVLTSQI